MQLSQIVTKTKVRALVVTAFAAGTLLTTMAVADQAQAAPGTAVTAEGVDPWSGIQAGTDVVDPWSGIQADTDDVDPWS